MFKYFWTTLFFIFSLVLPGYAGEITLGSSLPLSGHVKFLGQNLVLGMKSYFNYVNANGGIKGNKIKLVALDDKYEPSLTVKNTQKFINEIHPYALIGYVGTPTTVKILNMITKAKLPLIGPFTGAHQLRLPFRRYVFNIRNSYWAEVEALVDYAIKDLGKDKIAVFYQDDAYGLTGYKGVKRALGLNYNKEVVAEAVYTRGHKVPQLAVDTICQAKPQVVIMIGTYDACSDFILRAQQKGLKAVFMNISFVGPTPLAKLLGNKGNGVIVSNVVPPPSAEYIGCQEYRKLMQKYFPDQPLTFVGLEGFLDAKVMVKALMKVTDFSSPENLVQVLEQFKNVPTGMGVTLNYGPRDREGLDVVYLTMIQNGQFKLIKAVKKSISMYIF